MFQGALTVQSASTIIAVREFSWVKLLPLVDRSTPPYITGISDQDYLALRTGYPQAVGGGNFLPQFLKTLLLSGGPPSGSSFLDYVSEGGRGVGKIVDVTPIEVTGAHKTPHVL